MKDYLENKHGHIKDVFDTPLGSLLCPERDDVILTSAQYCVLPLNKGTCEFNVHLHNYQSSSDEPAVLLVVGCSAGSSAQAIYGGTTALYFNDAGKAANFVAERLKDGRERLGKAVEGKMNRDESERNALFVYQIPLKVSPKKAKPQAKYFLNTAAEAESFFCSLGMDDAVLSVGESYCDFTGIKNAKLERDPQFPIRCTIQFYKVTDEADVPEAEFKDMAENINRIYKSAEKTGSLVTEDSDRKTEWVFGNKK